MAARRNGRRLGGEGGDTYIYYPEIVLEVLTKTDTYSVQKSDSGKVLVMNSGDTKQFDLPSVDASDIGLMFTFVTIGAGKLEIDPADADVIDDSTATTGVIHATAAAGVVPVLTIILVSATQWAIKGANGTWTTT